MFDVLGKRLSKYGLTLHVDKTHYVDFRPRRPTEQQHPATDAATFNFLGFTHIWGTSRKGNRVVRQVTAKDRYARSLKAIWRWCKTYWYLPLKRQHEHLVRVMRGHYAYYGITGNAKRLNWYHYRVGRIWKQWLGSRSQKGTLTWDRMQDLLERYPLPPAMIVRQCRNP